MPPPLLNKRSGQNSSEQADMNIGPVADDNVYRSMRLLETGVLGAQEEEQL